MTSSHDRDWACAVLRWTQTVLQDPRMLATARHDRHDTNDDKLVFSCLQFGVLGTWYLVLGTWYFLVACLYLVRVRILFQGYPHGVVLGCGTLPDRPGLRGGLSSARPTPQPRVRGFRTL